MVRETRVFSPGSCMPTGILARRTIEFADHEEKKGGIWRRSADLIRAYTLGSVGGRWEAVVRCPRGVGTHVGYRRLVPSQPRRTVSCHVGQEVQADFLWERGWVRSLGTYSEGRGVCAFSVTTMLILCSVYGG